MTDTTYWVMTYIRKIQMINITISELKEALGEKIDNDFNYLLGEVYDEYGILNGDITPYQSQVLDELKNKFVDLTIDLMITNYEEEK